LAIEAFNRLSLPLKIIGDGPYRKNLERMAKSNIEFLGKVPADVLAEKYSRCRALIFPGDEDFGIVPVEAQACGRPVIAYAAGGALETVIENVTGIFFRTPSVDALMDAVEQFRKTESCFNPAQIRSNSFRFDEEIFKREIKCFIEKRHREFQKEQ
jgi:glycosyltransferase involved in cell wall biosynthesis